MNKRFPKSILITSVVLMCTILVAASLYVQIYDSYASMVLERELDRLLTIARDNAKKTELYLSWQQDHIAEFCMREDLIENAARYDETGCADKLRSNILSFVLSADNDAVASAFVDKSGQVVACYSNSAVIQQVDFTALPLKDLKRRVLAGFGGVFEIQPKDYALVLIHGVMRDQQYLGALLCAYRLETLERNLIEPSYIGNCGYISIQDTSGLCVLHPAPDRVGVNVLATSEDCAADEQELRRTQYSRERGKMVYHSRLWQQEDAPACIKLVGYARTSIGDDFFIINAVNLYDEVLKNMDGFMLQAALLSVIVALILLFGISGLLIMRSRWQLSRQELQYMKDLTVLKEAQRKQNEQIRHHQQVNSVGMFVSGIAHEFSNQLTTILIDADILSHALAGNPEMKECAEEIYQAGLREKEFVSQLLLISKKGRETEHYTLLEFDALITKNLRMIERMLPAGIRLEFTSQARGATILGNERQIAQMLTNLCTNAIQAMKDRPGLIAVRTQLVSKKDMILRYPKRAVIGDYVRLSVEDQGIGMDQQTLAQIFEPFFTTKSGRDGTGLGLTIISDMIDEMNGWCDAHSEPSVGSRFDLYFPCCASARQITGASAHTVFVLGLGLAEKKALEHALNPCGWKAVFFSTHSEMLTALQLDPLSCNVLIVDSQYAGCDIISVIKTAKHIQSGLRTVLLTKIHADDIDRLHRFTIVDLLQPRPVVWQQLASWISHSQEVSS